MDNNNEKYSFIKNSNTIFDFLKFLLSSLLYYLLEKYNIDKNILFNTENLSGLDTNQQKYFISLTRQKLWKFDINSSQDQRLEHFKKTFIPVLRNFFNKYDYLIKLYVKCNEEPNEIIKLDCIINNYIFKDLIDNYIFITEKEKQNHGANNEVEGAEQELNKANGDYVFKFNAFKLARNVVEKAKRKLKQAKRKLKQAKRKLKEAERKLEEAKENISKIYPVHDAKCKLKEACLKAEKAIKSENAKKLVDETRQKINEAIKVEEANINELNLVGNKVKEAERKLEEAKENRRKINPVYDAKYNLKKACLKADKAVREVEEFEEVSEEAIDKAEKAKKLVEARDKAEKLVKEARQKMNEAIKADNEANNVVNISVAKIMSG